MNFDRKTIENDERYLRQISKEVGFNSDDLNYYISKLKEYCINHSCYALAPVQIGIPKRIIYIKNSKQNMDNNIIDGYDEGIIYINPIIIEANGLTSFLEGCASCVYRKDDEIIYYAAIINRPYSIKVKYFDINGKEQTKLIEGFEATVFCHEYDHLNGVLHMDRAKDIYEMTIEEMKQYRLEHPYEVISKTKEYKLF